jgi:hypothetical protein
MKMMTGGEVDDSTIDVSKATEMVMLAKATNARTGRFEVVASQVSALTVCVYVALYQSGLVSYLGAHMAHAAWLTLVVLAIGAVIAGLAMIGGHLPRKSITAVWVFAAAGVAPLLFSHGDIGPVTKSYVVGLGSISLLSVAARCADLRRVAQFSAFVVCVACVGCLLDACHLHGFSDTTGRAAFLYVNPNVAALGLLLAALSSGWSLPLRWLPSFLVLVGGAVFVTLSRSAVLMAVLTLVACMPMVSENYRSTLLGLRTGIRSAIAVGVAVMAFCVVALNVNLAFPVALANSYDGMKTAIKWAEVGQSKIGMFGLGGDPKDVEKAIHLVEEQNSASARALLAERAWHQFEIGPATGIGLERAFALAPHNSYLLFADAFGYYGWLIIPALIALILYLGRRRGLPAAVLVAVSALFSHDLLFALPLISSFALIIGSLIKKNGIAEQERHVTAVSTNVP